MTSRPSLLTSAIVLALACVGAGACGHTTEIGSDGRIEDKNVSYRVSPPGPGWRAVSLPTANAAWFHDELGASLLVNSHCKGVGDPPLQGLTSDLMMGMTEREILQQERMPFDGREALQSVATAKLDGVPRKLALFVLKKDGCVYDIVLDAAPDRFEQARGAFQTVRDGLHVDARPGRR